MKKIEAIIRKTKFEEVKEALLNSNIDWFEYYPVHGIGQSRQERIYRGVQYSTDVIERMKISIVCRDVLGRGRRRTHLRIGYDRCMVHSHGGEWRCCLKRQEISKERQTEIIY